MADVDKTNVLSKAPDLLRSTLAALSTHTRYDLSHYRQSTVLSGLRRRMDVYHLEDPADYLRRVREDPDEAQHLLRELAVSAAGFFQDPETFQVLEQVIAGLVQDKPAGVPLRVWVPGCATGEEAYSITMLLVERLQALHKRCPVKVFATDVDMQMLNMARVGSYSAGRVAGVPPERLQRFFTPHGRQRYRVSKSLREQVVFAVHRLVGDPPLSRLDLISCYTGLIPFKTSVQKDLIKLFHFALREDGYLSLGQIATVAPPDELFEPLAKDWRAYRRRETTIGLSRTVFSLIDHRRNAVHSIPAPDQPPPTEPVYPGERVQTQWLAGGMGVQGGAPAQGLGYEFKRLQAELHSALEEQKITNEELMSANAQIQAANEELQALNEELETSKEELQSLNDELTRVNRRLADKVRELKTVNDDLANLLSSTAIATLFLDTQLRIKRFTPAIQPLLNLLPADLGRPLGDLAPKFHDGALLADAATVLEDLKPREAEVYTGAARCYIRRILPYRTQEHRIAGVVITFIEITERKQAELALRAAKEEAEQANSRKSRCLAAVNHDLRQPLQALTILNALLTRQVKDQTLREMLQHQGSAIGIMGDVLDALLDLRKLDLGALQPQPTAFPVSTLFGRLRSEFEIQAQEKGVRLRLVPSGAVLYSDWALLERILQNFLSNALKHSNGTKVLLGCRRRGAYVRLEVWDNGVGIPENQQQAIFEEFVQLNNPMRDRNRGLGLGLAIVDRLARLLHHPVEVHSHLGRGARFVVRVPRGETSERRTADSQPAAQVLQPARLQGTVLLLEDESMIEEALRMLLEPVGLRLVTAATPDEALAQRGAIQPDLIIADYRLPGNETGVQAILRMRRALGRALPAILLTGDTSLGLADDEGLDFPVLYKPFEGDCLIGLIRRLIPGAGAAPEALP